MRCVGCSYGVAEQEAKKFIEQYNLPFLATPMGKGTLDDRHPLSVGAARSTALKDADCIVLLGARLNWMLHFGKPPRFDPNVKIIQVEECRPFRTVYVASLDRHGHERAAQQRSECPGHPS